MMLKCEWDGEKYTMMAIPTLDEVVARYYKWDNTNDGLFDVLRDGAMRFIKENHMEEAAEKYPELML